MASSSTQTEVYVPLKLVVDEKSNKVIFAEAGKDFVDVLFSFLTFPLGTITRLIQKDSNIGPVTFGCLNNLYQSVVDLDKKCLENETDKEMLLQPSNSLEDYCSFLKLNIDDTKPLKYYICSKSRFPCDYSDVLSTSKTCIHCLIGKTPVVSLGKQFCKGFVNDGETFFITDDLKVFPESIPRSAMLQLWFFGSNHSSSIKERTVNVTKEKVFFYSHLSSKCFFVRHKIIASCPTIIFSFNISIIYI
jgi:hypothetical protein